MVYNSIIDAVARETKEKRKNKCAPHAVHTSRRRNRDMTDPEQESQSIRDGRVLLGLNAKPITKESVIAAWKRKLTEPPKTAHIENDAYLICLNQAKETLLEWINHN